MTSSDSNGPCTSGAGDHDLGAWPETCDECAEFGKFMAAVKKMRGEIWDDLVERL